MNADDCPNKPLGWWTLSGEDFLDALRRAASGEDPDLVYAEMYVNSEHQRPTRDSD